MHRLSYLKAFLEEHGLAAKKGLSQNFLIDGNILRKIADLAHVEPGDTVLEIGPGPGVLTEELLRRGAHVIAVELDRDFARLLRETRPDEKNLEVIHADFMELDLDTLLKGRQAKVVSNLPYHITSPILTRLAERNDLFSSITAVIQKEVAERIVADPGSKRYGSISVFLRFFSDPKYGFTIKKTCFYPAPKVDSATIFLELHTPPQVCDRSGFLTFMRKSFQQRRKMLRNTVKDLFPAESIEEELIKLSILPTARPETLSLEQFIALYDALTEKHK